MRLNILLGLLALAEKATPGPCEVWKDHAEVYFGPAKINTPAKLQGVRARLCDLDDIGIDTDELDDVPGSEWTAQERIAVNRFNDAALVAAVYDPLTGYAAVCRELLERQTPVKVDRAEPFSIHPSRCGACGQYCGYTDTVKFCPNCGRPLLWEEKA